MRRPRLTAVLGFSAAAFGAGMMALAGLELTHREAVQAPRPTPALSVSPSASAKLASPTMAASPSARPVLSPTPFDIPAVLPPDHEAAEAVAGRFAAAYGSYRWDALDATRANVRPYDTDALDVILGDNQGMGVGFSDHRVVVVTATQVVDSGLTPDGHLGVVVLGRSVMTSDMGRSAWDVHYELHLAKTSRGWLVDQVVQS